jgi:penicillin-binding protein 2
MAGKTGTAQSHSYATGHGAHGAQGAWSLRDHGWFIAFAPADEPRYAMAVLVEHGGFGGEAAAPKAREIMRTVLLKDPDILKRIQRSGAAIDKSLPDMGPADTDTADDPSNIPSTPLPDDGDRTT